MDVTAAVIREKSAPFKITKIVMGEPQAGEVLIKITAVGICHTDVSMQQQLYPVPFPIVLGHEGAGVIEKIGNDVSGLSIGDHVVLSFNYCGSCKACEAGAPAYCSSAYALNFGGCRPDGSSALSNHNGVVHGHFFGQSSFCNYAIAAKNSVVKVPKDLPLELLAPLGCGLQTGAGAILNTFKMKAESTIVVFGVGNVGLAAIMAARAIDATVIVAVDVYESRIKIAESLGATHGFLANTDNLLEELLNIVPQGFDYSLDTSGRPEVLRVAFDCLGYQGRAGLIGAAPAGLEASFNMQHLLFGRSVQGIIQGDSIPQLFIPQLIELYRKGLFPFDKLISAYPFESINDAIADMEEGAVLKPVLMLPA